MFNAVGSCVERSQVPEAARMRGHSRERKQHLREERHFQALHQQPQSARTVVQQGNKHSYKCLDL